MPEPKVLTVSDIEKIKFTPKLPATRPFVQIHMSGVDHIEHWVGDLTFFYMWDNRLSAKTLSVYLPSTDVSLKPMVAFHRRNYKDQLVVSDFEVGLDDAIARHHLSGATFVFDEITIYSIPVWIPAYFAIQAINSEKRRGCLKGNYLYAGAYTENLKNTADVLRLQSRFNLTADPVGRHWWNTVNIEEVVYGGKW